MLELIEYHPDGDFTSDNENKLYFDSSAISKIDVNEVIDKKPSNNDGAYEYSVKSTPQNCAKDNGFNNTKTASEADDKTRHNGFDMGEAVIRGVKEIGENTYVINEGENISLFYRVITSRNDITKYKPSSATKFTIFDDTYSKSIYATNTTDVKVGYGLIITRCTYEDGTTEETHVTDVFEATYAGDLKPLKIKTDKKIKEIKVIVLYEIYTCRASLSATVWNPNWEEYSNWRCEYNFKFTN